MQSVEYVQTKLKPLESRDNELEHKVDEHASMIKDLAQKLLEQKYEWESFRSKELQRVEALEKRYLQAIAEQDGFIEKQEAELKAKMSVISQ